MLEIPFEGIIVKEREDDGLISLTDLWKASALPSSKRPNRWIENEGTREYLAQELGVEKHQISDVSERFDFPGFLEVRRGRKGGIYAIKRIALAYAKWLSPELHQKVNDVFVRIQEGDSEVAEAALDKVGERKEREALRGEPSDPEESRRLARIQGKVQRIRFTDLLSERVRGGMAFGYVTNQLYRGLFGCDARELRRQKGLHPKPGKKGETRDALSTLETNKIAMGEIASFQAVESQNLYGWQDCGEAAYQVGVAVSEQLDKIAQGVEVSSEPTST